MPDRYDLTDDCKERITEQMQSLTEYDPGDRVTVEPTDHDTSYAGSEMEGMMLTISHVTWRGDDLTTPQKARRYTGDYPDSDERWVETPENEYWDRLWISTWRYAFEERDQPYYNMSESSLMPWSEHREQHDRIILDVDTDGNWNTKVYLEPSDPCEYCGCNRQKVRHSNQPHAALTAGSRACAGCGHVISEKYP